MLHTKALRQQLPHHRPRRQIQIQKVQGNLEKGDQKTKVTKPEMSATIQASDTRHLTGPQKILQQDPRIKATVDHTAKGGINKVSSHMNTNNETGAMTIVAQREEAVIVQGHQPQEPLPIRATKVAAIHTVKIGTIAQKENTVLTTEDNGIDQDITIKDAGITMMNEYLLACKFTKRNRHRHHSQISWWQTVFANAYTRCRGPAACGWMSSAWA